MDVQTYFFRRTNMNALGQPRNWTDHLLWHHATATVDLFATRRAAHRQTNAIRAPSTGAGHCHGHEHQLQAANGAICTLS